MSRQPPISSPNGARLTRSALVALSVLLAGALLAACGSSDPTSDAAASERAQEEQAETKFADFAKCLREHGVNAEVAAGPNGGHGLKVSPGKAGGPEAFEAAQKACARYRPEPKKVNLSPQQKVEQEEAVQRFAKCMREHGIKVEASAQGGGIRIGIHSGKGEPGAPNPESPGFQQAQSSCQKLLPKPPGGGPGLKGGPPSSSKDSEGHAGGGLALSGG
ncbi:MAG TPA: hypothetical protein VGY13_00645 [Solirubrobacteraceae bacterium]|jgi:hypothetical protein|nr:hypothetical protein [Solirubrobacteraceae bacterium]